MGSGLLQRAWWKAPIGNLPNGKLLIEMPIIGVLLRVVDLVVGQHAPFPPQIFRQLPQLDVLVEAQRELLALGGVYSLHQDHFDLFHTDFKL
jgi:hypothetical protein